LFTKTHPVELRPVGSFAKIDPRLDPKLVRAASLAQERAHGDELMRSYGLKRLPIHDPYAAPIGAVLVYGNKTRGRVEIRTKDGFVSDYHSKYRCFYPLIAVYGKFGS